MINYRKQKADLVCVEERIAFTVTPFSYWRSKKCLHSVCVTRTSRLP
jgi:hypothetical protein